MIPACDGLASIQLVIFQIQVLVLAEKVFAKKKKKKKKGKVPLNGLVKQKDRRNKELRKIEKQRK